VGARRELVIVGSGGFGISEPTPYNEVGTMKAADANDGTKPLQNTAGRRRRPGTQSSKRHVRGPAVPWPGAFWLVTGALSLLFFTSGAPSALYDVYQAQWKFSTTILTAVFAMYALFLLLTLLVFGSVADYIGRRRVILASLLITAVACALFLLAGGVGLLFVARALQGVAVGLGTEGIGATLIDLQPRGGGRASVATGSATLLGLGAGALVTSALVQYGPAPTHLVWWLLLGASLAVTVGVLAVPETVPRRPGVITSLRPRVAVPAGARASFIVAAPCLVAAWALNGLYLSLGPSLAVQVFASPNLLWGGLVIFLLMAAGAAATVVLRAVSPPVTMLSGCLALVAGTVVTIVAIETTSGAAFLAGAALAGAGFGAAVFLGAYRTVTALASPNQRAGIIAAIFTLSYLAFSVPVVIAGLATSHFGLHRTALVYCGIFAVLAAGASVNYIFHRPPHDTMSSVAEGTDGGVPVRRPSNVRSS
jgi:MFS family permease